MPLPDGAGEVATRDPDTLALPESNWPGQIRDSASITIVEYDGEPAAPRGELSLLWTHGHQAGDYGFQDVPLGALRADGSAVVSDRGNREVVAIDSSGRGHVVLATTGEGPAEVARPRQIVSSGGDDVWVEDAGGKLMLFRVDSLVSTISAQREDLARAMPVGADRQGRLLMISGGYMPEPDPAPGWMYGYFTRLDPQTTVLDTVGSYPAGFNSGEDQLNAFSPFGMTTVADYGFVRARSDIPTITWLDADGMGTRIVRWEPTLAYPTNEAWDRFEQGYRDDLSRSNPQVQGDQLDEIVSQLLARYGVDPSVPLPLFGPIYGSPEGEVWLSEYQPVLLWPTVYTVLSGEGEWLARLEFPEPFLVLDIRDGMVLGVVTDDLDVQAIRLYRYRVGSGVE